MNKLLLILLLSASCTIPVMNAPECNYTLPNGFVLLYDKNKEAYGIKTNSDSFLCLIGICCTSCTSDANNAALFTDSCIAKSYAHEYAKHTHVDFIDVKEIKKITYEQATTSNQNANRR